MGFKYLVRDQEAVGSNPIAPTIISPLDSTGYAAFSTSGFTSFLRTIRTTSAILDGSAKPKLTVSDCSKRNATSSFIESIEVIRAQIMFKQLHYGRGKIMDFGCTGSGWKRKDEIANELGLYRPWSIVHVAAKLGAPREAYRHMQRIVEDSNSPTELAFFKAWWAFSDDLNRPMLFAQVNGHTSGKFCLPTSKEESVPVHFDFGLVNVVKKSKILIECDSRRYHSDDERYQGDRDRQKHCGE
jgi:hypothetical protein